MIASLRGQLNNISENAATIDVGGVGYRVAMSTQSLATLGELGREVSVLITMIVREDNISLYGFLEEQEQLLFEKLITVSGIGPKVAISALSTLNAAALSQAIVNEDDARLATIPGLGKKTAQRVILELSGKIAAMSSTDAGKKATALPSVQASEALLGMGFTSTEIALALEGYDGNAKDTAAIVRYGLKRLGTS